MLNLHKDEEREAQRIRRRQQSARQKERASRRLYGFVAKIPFVSGYVRGLEYGLRRLYSYDKGTLARIAAGMFAGNVVKSLLIASVVFVCNWLLDGRVTMYSVCCVALAMYFALVEIQSLKFQQLQRFQDKEFVRYLSQVKRIYLSTKNVSSAVIDGAANLSRELKLHADKIYGVLTSAGRQEKIKDYVLSKSNGNYMKLFANQAYAASERGDVYEGRDSLLEKNLEFLRIEIMRERLKREKRAFRLRGFTFVTIAPVFLMSLLRIVGIDFSPNLREFYSGIGIIVQVLAFVVTILLYRNLCYAREVSMRMVEGDKQGRFHSFVYSGKMSKVLGRVEKKMSGYSGKVKRMLLNTGSNSSFGAFFVRMFLYGAAAFGICIVIFLTMHSNAKKELLTNFDNADQVISTVTMRQKEAIKTAVLDMVNEYKDEEGVSHDFLVRDFRSRVRVLNMEVVDSVVGEVERRITAYNDRYLKWYEFLFSLLSMFAISFIPFMELRFQESLMKTEKEDEIRQFQSIVLMERHFPETTISGLLEKMETFSTFFRASIRECINDCSSGTREALLAFRAREKDNESLVELIDCFLAVDNVGIEVAFAEVEKSREMEEKTKEFMSEIALSKQGDLAEVLSYIPSVLVIGFYFIVPFMADAFGGVMEMFDAMEELGSVLNNSGL